ncbi:DUF938 domain-containing protein [Marinagarivorans cellulosilyticus]|uniref:Methylase n=1 Tax=Marinagarivorans cellulosilyticus TaxID=2721545 RepID=A0AAN1WGU8_9GAMM|nr:DUF938 domain-containing protein [Marinagarivorans cellulosilyticus]BCD97334.1 hypothetical protein MARGE09_P1535 [Marinagarivorans cellulosilyticus]
MFEKPFSQACENNKYPICEHLQRLLATTKTLLEIGSGTGQHAVYFSAELPHLQWQTSDRLVNHEGINLWINENPQANLLHPIALDVISDPWPQTQYNAIYSANTAHIMPWAAVQAMFKGVGELLTAGGIFVLYGPFKINGDFTSDSNAQFDAFLRENQAEQGIRNLEDLVSLATAAGLTLRENNPMPANNQLLVFKKD